ncbi:MAG: signal peptide peptidase SppA [Muribaculaceae bacterium]|nr:signal peptide peptidase SppA [Muribaculaceae bacterium]
MLKRFLLNMLSSFVGAWIALALFILSVVLLLVGLAGNMAISAGKGVEQVKSRSILTITLDGPIEEREAPFEPDLSIILNGRLDAPQTLDVICQSIREAAKNDDIVAIYLKCGSPSASPATLNAIREELIGFRKTTDGKKKILAYGDGFSQGCYFVASAADSIFMNPAGEMGLQGLSSSNFYMKGLLDRLGVQFQVVKVGTYKSAVEPYILENMSEPARAQMDTLLGTMWGYIRSQISESRKGLTASAIDSLVSQDYIAFSKAESAVKAGLVDSLVYEREMNRRLAAIAGREEKKLNFVSPATLVAGGQWASAYSSKRQIAVLYACGEIADGNSNQINYENLVPVIVKLADDDNVKGLVLRVNSPGGSVYGSTQIGEALDYFQSKGKPLAVSMGDYAASGGYWISADADRIFADPLTVTGSIGIFGLLPNFKGTLDKLGVNVATVSTNPGAAFPSGFRPLDETQLAVMQKYVDRGYDDFTSRVAKGRKMKKEKVLSIAEGRVWSAITAQRIGLVDSLGGLRDAVEWTAAKAGVRDNYDVAAYPQVEPTVWNLIRLGAMTMAELKDAVDARDEDRLKIYLMRRILSRKPVQARMQEFRIDI